MVDNAIVAAQHSRGGQPHQFLHLRRDRAVEIGVVVNVVEALDQKVVGLGDVSVEAGAGVNEAAGKFAFVSDLLLCVLKYGLFSVAGHVPSSLPLSTKQACCESVQ